MPTRQREDLKKHTIRLRRGDVANLDAAFPKIGHNGVIRKLVSDFVDKLAREGAIPTIDLPEDLTQ